MKQRSFFSILAIVAAVGCSSEAPTNIGNNNEDEAGVDVPPPKDTGTTDTGPRDTGPADTGPRDTGPADTGMSPDAETPDSGAPDVTTPDVTAPDVTAPDVVVPDVTAPDVSVPDVTVMDAGAPDVTVPDVMVPDVTAPDVTVPDVMVPDVTVPDTGAVDVPRPDVVVMDGGMADAAADVVVCTPTTETCNDRDDDCDGLIDESGCGTHLLLTEVVAGPTEAEYIEIHNPTSAPINLSNVYLTDFNDYACVLGATCTIPGRAVATLGSSDFVARFPDGATLAPGAYATIATGQPGDFPRLLGGQCPTYYFPRTTPSLGACTMSQPMRQTPNATAAAPSIGSSAGITNDGEPITLFQWDGTAALVQDLDYFVHGAPSTANAQVDKTGIMVVRGSLMATYRSDTAVAMQQQGPRFANGGANVRCHMGEGAEVRTGGNGATGHDETSERFTLTWRATTPAVAMGDAGLTSVNASPNAANNCQ